MQLKKKDLLTKKVDHIDIKKINSVDIIEAMKKMSFSARDLANASDIYNRMLKEKNCAVILTLAGSTSIIFYLESPDFTDMLACCCYGRYWFPHIRTDICTVEFCQKGTNQSKSVTGILSFKRFIKFLPPCFMGFLAVIFR